MRTWIPAAISILMFPACASTRTKAASDVRVTDARGVAACQFVGTFSGSAQEWHPFSPGTFVENMKTEVLEQAARAGATDLVWLSMAGPHGAANAYRCGSAAASR